MISVSDIQAWLNTQGLPAPLKVDGVAGRRTMAAVDGALARALRPDPAWQDWGDARRLVAAEQLVYKAAGLEIGRIDGLVGPQTTYIRQVYAARLDPNKLLEITRWRDKEPVPITPSRRWPKQRDVEKVFGKPGSSLVSVRLPYKMVLAWDRSVSVSTFQAHKLVAEPIQRVLSRTLDHYSLMGVQELRLNLFGGCFNIRKMRGGSALSMHSWGIAVDIDPERNQLRWGRALASLDEKVYDPWWKFWEDEGAVSLGRTRDYDWMHIQFAEL